MNKCENCGMKIKHCDIILTLRIDEKNIDESSRCGPMCPMEATEFFREIRKQLQKR